MKKPLVLFPVAVLLLLLVAGASLIGTSQAYNPPNAESLSGEGAIRFGGEDLSNGDVVPVAYMPAINGNYCQPFFDDFSDPLSGWQTGATTYFNYNYANGEYSIKSKRSGRIFVLSSPACQRENYSVEVSARWLGETGSSYGLLFVIKDNFETFYIFDINTDLGEIRIIKQLLGNPAEVEYHKSSPAILPGSAWNRLKVLVNGSFAEFFINDQSVLDEWFGSPMTGFAGAGLTAAPYGDRPIADARFDDFVMRYLAPDETPGSLVASAPEQYRDLSRPSENNPLAWPLLDFNWPESEQE